MNFKWTYKQSKLEGKKHSSRIAFKKNARGCYDACQRNGWLYKICMHMKSPTVNREKKLQMNLYYDLIKNHKGLEITLEYIIPKRDNSPGRIDFFIKNTENNKSIALELKHSESKWSQNDLKTQKSKYNRAFRDRSGFMGVYFLCDTKKYGIPLNQIDKIMKKIL